MNELDKAREDLMESNKITITTEGELEIIEGHMEYEEAPVQLKCFEPYELYAPAELGVIAPLERMAYCGIILSEIIAEDNNLQLHTARELVEQEFDHLDAPHPVVIWPLESEEKPANDLFDL